MQVVTGVLEADDARPAVSGIGLWWRRLAVDDASAYLSQSVDHVDLACRMQCWNEVERHDRLPLV